MTCSITGWSRKKCTNFNAPSFCNRLQYSRAVFNIKMPTKGHCLEDNAKFIISVCWIFFDKQPELDTCYERHYPACEHYTSDSWNWRLAANKRLRKLKKLACWKNDSWVCIETVEMACAVWSLAYLLSKGVAKIWSAVHFFLKKSWRPFLVVAFKRRFKGTKWTSKSLLRAKKCHKN